MPESITLLLGDSLDLLKTIPDNSIDSLVTDPPAGILFLNKNWDSDKGGRDNWINWLSSILCECLRVLKPGAHALVWALPRTSHWTATALENSGFQIRDNLSYLFDPDPLMDAFWQSLTPEQAGLLEQVHEALHPSIFYHVFGVGFPKSRNIGNDIEKVISGGKDNREIIGYKPGLNNENNTKGFAYNKEYSPGVCIGGKQISGQIPIYKLSPQAEKFKGFGTALKPAVEFWILARKPFEGNIADNVLQFGTGALNIDACRIPTDEKLPCSKAVPYHAADGSQRTWNPTSTKGIKREQHEAGRFPANLIHDGSDKVMGEFPDRKTTWVSPEHSNNRNGEFLGALKHPGQQGFNDSGSAARFFYSAKASKKDRGENNTHPTVKPTQLMQYLCKLITPPNGTILDPFMGSGTTGKAALLEGFSFVGVEKDPEYFKIAEARIKPPKYTEPEFD